MRQRKDAPTGGKVIPLRTRAAPVKDSREEAFNLAFGTRLRTYREGMGWSQARIAAYLGIGKDQYKKYEYGSRSFPLYLLPLLRDVSDRSYAEWMSGLNTPQRIIPAKP